MADATTIDRLPQDKRSKDQDRFTFRTVRGRIIDIPSQGFTPLPVLMALRAFDGLEGDEIIDHLHLLYDLADDAEGRKGLESLGIVELQRLLKLWRRQGEAASGKSKA
ncbi:hypothetical protein AB2L57_10660 [Microbacterium sp. HA-8]|uniref:hypothetical protein n=1 Tax=Microbacterium sp. HA-8 TaxID=3234200 RepID=UPI0038F626D4